MYRAGQTLHLLNPKKLRFYRQQQRTEGLCLQIVGDNGRVGECYPDITVHLMFPLSHPDNLITLCDRQGQEIGVLQDVTQMEAASRQILEQELQVSYFVPKITQILSIKDEYGLVHWQVETDRGLRKFQVQSRYDIRNMGQGRYIVRDIDGNRYDIVDVANLDNASRSLLELEI